MADSLEERMSLPTTNADTGKSKQKPTKPDDLVRLYDIALQVLLINRLLNGQGIL